MFDVSFFKNFYLITDKFRGTIDSEYKKEKNRAMGACDEVALRQKERSRAQEIDRLWEWQRERTGSDWRCFDDGRLCSSGCRHRTLPPLSRSTSPMAVLQFSS